MSKENKRDARPKSPFGWGRKSNKVTKTPAFMPTKERAPTFSERTAQLRELEKKPLNFAQENPMSKEELSAAMDLLNEREVTKSNLTEPVVIDWKGFADVSRNLYNAIIAEDPNSEHMLSEAEFLLTTAQLATKIILDYRSAATQTTIAWQVDYSSTIPGSTPLPGPLADYVECCQPHVAPTGVVLYPEPVIPMGDVTNDAPVGEATLPSYFDSGEVVPEESSSMLQTLALAEIIITEHGADPTEYLPARYQPVMLRTVTNVGKEAPEWSNFRPASHERRKATLHPFHAKDPLSRALCANPQLMNDYIRFISRVDRIYVTRVPGLNSPKPPPPILAAASLYLWDSIIACYPIYWPPDWIRAATLFRISRSVSEAYLDVWTRMKPPDSKPDVCLTVRRLFKSFSDRPELFENCRYLEVHRYRKPNGAIRSLVRAYLRRKM